MKLESFRCPAIRGVPNANSHPAIRGVRKRQLPLFEVCSNAPQGVSPCGCVLWTFVHIKTGPHKNRLKLTDLMMFQILIPFLEKMENQLFEVCANPCYPAIRGVLKPSYPAIRGVLKRSTRCLTLWMRAVDFCPHKNQAKYNYGKLKQIIKFVPAIRGVLKRSARCLTLWMSCYSRCAQISYSRCAQTLHKVPAIRGVLKRFTRCLTAVISFKTFDGQISSLAIRGVLKRSTRCLTLWMRAVDFCPHKNRPT
jgi:hypothetical protein